MTKWSISQHTSASTQTNLLLILINESYGWLAAASNVFFFSFHFIPIVIRGGTPFNFTESQINKERKQNKTLFYNNIDK